MILRQLFDAPSGTYTYLLADPESREAVLIDTVFEQHLRDVALIRELGLTLKYTCETHTHADHVTGAWLMHDALGSQIVTSKHAGAECADVLIDEGDVVSFGSQSLEVRSTPGHTDGCVTYVTSDHEAAFTGDALLIRGAGRTDFQQGDARVLFRSVREKIFTLPDDCILYPGHDYSGRTMTTVAEEKAFNPRLGDGKAEGDFVGYMDNLGLPHPRKIDIAVPANIKCGRPDAVSEEAPHVPDWAPLVRTFAGVLEVQAPWVNEHRQELTLLDVRKPEELGAELGHIDGVINIPIDELRDRVEEIPDDKPVVTVCHSGARSSQAASILEKAGFAECANLAGGMIRWIATGLPTSGHTA